MINRRVVHVYGLDSVNAIFPSFVELVRRRLGTGDQLFLTLGDIERLPYDQGPDTLHLPSTHRSVVRLVLELHKARKIVLHGLFSSRLVRVLFLHPWLLKKCYWVMWGGDFYNYQPRERRRGISALMLASVIRRMGYLVTSIRGDYELASRWFGALGAHVECFVYPRPIVENPIKADDAGAARTILVGNSANPSNDHLRIFERLLQLDDGSFKVLCPLSYGDRNHASKVAEAGEQLFGCRFQPLLEFIPLDEYFDVLNGVDIAVFGHERQQALGSIVMLLSLGKKVYMRTDITPTAFFSKIGVRVFDVDELNLEAMSAQAAITNSNAVREYFSEENLVAQLRRLLKE